jgi:heat shock protein HslJ
MSDDLENELRTTLCRVADAVPTEPVEASVVPLRSARRAWPSAAVAAALVLLAALGTYWATRDGGDTQTVATEIPATTDPTVIDDTGAAGFDGAYLLVAGVLDGNATPIVAGSEPTLVIARDEWGGTAACNSYGGTAVIDADSRVSIDGFASTGMGCEPALMASEAAYLAALGRVDTIARGDADLITLSGDGVTLGFERQAPAEEAGGPFTDIDWQLDTIVEGDTARHEPPPWGTLRLGRDGSLYADGPCVVLTGSYVFDGIELRPTEMAADYAVSCGGEPGPDDNAIISIIEGARPEVTDGGRRLTLSQGADQLVYLHDLEEASGGQATPLDFGIASVVAVTDDLTLVQLSGDGADVERSVELADAIPGLLAVDSVTYDPIREVAYLGVRRSGGDSLDCVGSIVQIDWTGAARNIDDGRLPIIDASSTRLGYLQSAEVEGDCLFTTVMTRYLESAEITIDDIDDVASGSGPNAHLAWDGDSLLASSEGRSFSAVARGDTAVAADVGLATALGRGYIGQVGCCVPPMALVGADSLNGPWEERAALDAPIESLRAVGRSAILVDAAGTLLGYSADLGLERLGTGFVAADGAPS